MKTLTIRQPWAGAIIAGRKKVENRSWSTDYRGPLLIHAAKKIDPVAVLPDGGAPPTNPVTGAIIGQVELIDCLPVADCGGDPWAVGPWCWVLTDPRPIGPIPARGQLGLWTYHERRGLPQRAAIIIGVDPTFGID